MSFFSAVSDAVSAAADVVASAATEIADGVTRVVGNAREAANKTVDSLIDKALAVGALVSEVAGKVFSAAGRAFSPAAASAAKVTCITNKGMPIEHVTPTRKAGDAGFDEAKMYEKFKKSKTALALEKEVTKNGYKYAGDVADPKSSAYTDVAKKEIRINKNHSEDEAALAYAYELQNAKNGPKYNQIFKDASSGKIKDKKEFARQIMQHEAEALETEAIVTDEMGIVPPPNKAVFDIVKNTKDPAERRKKILDWADASGQIKGKKPSEHYEKMYEDNYAKKP